MPLPFKKYLSEPPFYSLSTLPTCTSHAVSMAASESSPFAYFSAWLPSPAWQGGVDSRIPPILHGRRCGEAARGAQSQSFVPFRNDASWGNNLPDLVSTVLCDNGMYVLNVYVWFQCSMNTDGGANWCYSCKEATPTMNFFPLHFFTHPPSQVFTHLQDSQIAVRGPPFASRVATRVQLPLGKQLLLRTIHDKIHCLCPARTYII